MHLTVIHPFTVSGKKVEGGEPEPDIEYGRGAKIFDENKIKEILGSSNARSVVRTAGQKPN